VNAGGFAASLPPLSVPISTLHFSRYDEPCLSEPVMVEGRYLKVVCSLLCLIVLASNLWTMRKWTERTGVYDDLCYLTQAHLFQRFGIAGFDTDISRDDDRFLATLEREIGYPWWNEPGKAVCHTPMKATGKFVIQYPPGTGLLMAMFPSGFQRVPLYAAADFIILLTALLAIWFARTSQAIISSAALGCLALFFMINPAKASFSVAPTLATCALAGYLMVVMFAARNLRSRLIATIMTGLLLGLSVSFRIPNLFLAAGPFLWSAVEAFKLRRMDAVLRLIIFGAAYLAGLAPTLVANTINAGSPFSTTYGPDDTVLDLSFAITKQYVYDMQGALIVAVLASAVWSLRLVTRNLVPAVVITNLACNLLFFLSHPLFNPYYLMPVAMLSLWSLLFNESMEGHASSGGKAAPLNSGPPQ
jgi:hypothetical protein